LFFLLSYDQNGALSLVEMLGLEGYFQGFCNCDEVKGFGIMVDGYCDHKPLSLAKDFVYCV